MTTTFIGAATGTLNFAGDSDWFGITLTGGTQYVFNLGNGTLSDPSITIYNSSGQVVYSGSANGGVGGPAGENAQIAFNPTSSGTYYIAASSTSGTQTGTFALTASTASFDVAGNINTTGNISVGSSATGTISTPGQNDFFKVSLTAGSEYVFNVSGALASSQNGVVTIYDSTGKELQAGTDYETANGNQIVFTAGSSGTYYVGVSGQNNGTGAFTLNAATATTDVGNTAATAGHVTVGGSVNGTLSLAQQRDWYGVTLTAGTEYTFSVSGGTLGGNATVALYDANGNNLVSQISGGTTNGAERSFTATTTGTYYVEAGSILGNTGSFTVGVTAVGTEANQGNVNTAGTISTSTTATGTLNAPGDTNWFKTTLTAGVTYAFKMTDGTTGGLSGAQVSLYDSTGKLITNYGASGSGTAEIVFTPTTTGTYFVGAAGQLANTGSYTIVESTVTPDVVGNVNTAGHVSVGGSSTSGTLATPGQHDWYKVTLTAGTQYVFNLGGALSNGEITLYNSAGTEITSGSSQASYLAGASGTYYVGVNSTSNATGAFTVSAATATDTYPPSTATTGVFTSAAGEVAAFQAGTLTSPNAISDSIANVVANLSGLEQVVVAGKLTSITLTDDQISSTPVINLTAAQYAAGYQVINELKGTYTLNVAGFSSAALAFIENTQGQGTRYLPGTSIANQNQVVEVTSVAAGAGTIAMGTAYNAVLVAGSHSTTASSAGNPDSFSFNVDANGVITLHDNNTGQNQTITGANYLIFNDGTQNSDGSFQQIYFIEGSTNSQITALYNAAFLRQPDLAGLEYYAAPLAAGTETLHQVATNFLASPEFLNKFPSAAAAADHGGTHDQTFITTLYQNVLNRTPGSAEVAFYANELANGSLDRAQLLINISASPENQADIASLLVNTTNGAYADSSALLSPTTVLGEVTAGSSLNTGAMAAVTSATTVNGITVDQTGTVTLGASAPTETVYLSPTYNNIVINNSGDTVYDTTVNATITVNGANNTLTLGHGGNGSTDAINLLGGTNTTVNGFAPGTGITLNVANTTNSGSVQLLNGTTTPVSGLDFTSGNNYVVNIGSVGTGSAAEVATAANKAYTVSDAAGEHVTFIGQTSSGNTVVFFFGSTSGSSNGIIPAASLTHTADTNANHLVDANEITFIATLTGVTTNNLTAADLA